MKIIKNLAVLFLIIVGLIGGWKLFSVIRERDFQESVYAIKNKAEPIVEGVKEKAKPIVKEVEKKINSLTEVEERDGQFYSKGICVMDDETGEIIFSKNPDKKLSPASLTKLMTALVSVDTIESLDDKVYLKQEMCDYLLKENAMVAGFAPGQSYPFNEVLYGLLLPSGADCAMMLSHKDGDASEFYKKMNEKALEIGMENTHFENETGLDSSGQYSTASDIAKLLRACLKNPTIKEVLTTEKYQTDFVPGYPKGIFMQHTILKKCNDAEKENIKGGKSGTTENAGLCWAVTSKIDGKYYEIVVLGAPLDDLSDPTLYQKADVLRLIELIKKKEF